MKIDQFIMSKKVIERLGDVLLLVGHDGSILDANAAALRCYGHTHTEMLALSIHDIRSPQDQGDFDNQLRQAALQGIEFEGEHCRRDGTVFPVEVWLAPVRVDGESALLSVVRDITERTQAESGLRGSESRLEAMFDHAPLGIALTDSLTGRMHEVNPAYARILGRTLEEIRQLDWMSYTHPDDVQASLANMALMNAGETSGYQMKKRYLRPDGTTVWVDMTVARVQDGDEAHPTHVAMIQDISAEVEVENLLAGQRGHIERTLTSVIDIAGKIVELRDPYTAGHQRRVSELATRIAQDLGMSDVEVADIKVAGLIHDIGKAGVPTEILGKPGPLTASEFNLIKDHAEAGHQIIVDAYIDDSIAEMVYQHHERIDGSGYPRGLVGNQILKGAKVLAVADVVEAMMSHRPYRPALGIDAALAEIERGAGSIYDAEVAGECVALFRESHFELSA